MKIYLGEFLKVTQMQGAVNQYRIQTTDGVVFQSYDTVIAFIRGGEVYLDVNWDSTRTTGKYRNIFLGEDKATTERKIEEGVYQVVNLN